MDDRAKRTLDVGIAVGTLVACMPVVAAISMVILISSGPPVLYLGDRLGVGGKVFRMYKFRTMQVGADRGAAITGKGDSRVTPIGRLLRRWKLDELPQLLNVIRGEMSMVGPRPEAPRYLADYSPAQRQVLTIRPGITGVSQLAFRHEELLLSTGDFERQYRQELLPKKLDLDLQYTKNRTLQLDLKLIAATVAAILSRP